MENEIHIPKGWDSATLSEITSKLVDGSHNPPPKQADGLPMLSAINIENNKINFSSYRLITKSSFELEDCRTRIKAGDVLLTIVGAIGRTAVVPDGIRPFTLQRSVAVLTPILVEPKFLMYQIESPDLSNFFMRNARGTAQKGIYLNVLGGTEILIPPLNEQKRIVAKIEELFSELYNATKCLLAAEAQQKIFYQSVLDNAFSNCKEHKKLEDLLSQKLSNGYSGKPVRYETNNRVLSLSSTTSGVFLDSHFKFLDEPALEDRDIWCDPNDILIQRGNTIEYVGVPAIFTGTPKRFIFPDLMIRVRANENLISTKFLYYALSSPKIRNYLRQKAKGSAGTMPKINQAILASLPIPFCSKEAQEKIVADIEEKLSNGLALERIIEEILFKSEALRQSILKKAFSGKLVAQDPNDEPAGVLLERIRAEKDAQETDSKKPKAKRNVA